MTERAELSWKDCIVTVAETIRHLMPSTSPRSQLQYPGSFLNQKVSRTQYRNVLKWRHQLKILVACDDTIRFSHESPSRAVCRLPDRDILAWHPLWIPIARRPRAEPGTNLRPSRPTYLLNLEYWSRVRSSPKVSVGEQQDSVGLLYPVHNRPRRTFQSKHSTDQDIRIENEAFNSHRPGVLRAWPRFNPFEAASAPRLSMVAVKRAHAAPPQPLVLLHGHNHPDRPAFLGHADRCALGGIEQAAEPDSLPLLQQSLSWIQNSYNGHDGQQTLTSECFSGLPSLVLARPASACS